MRRIAISDIHGHPRTFEKLLITLDFTKNDALYLLGDYISWGPNPVGVTDQILELKGQGYQISCLLGNHENALYRDVTSKKRKLNQRYIDFFASLQFYVELDDYLLVHAGFNFAIPYPPDDKKAMIELYGWYHKRINHEWLGARKIIFGHSVMHRQKIFDSINNNHQAIGIDNGVFVKDDPEKGNLCAYDFTNNKLYFQANIG